MKNKPTNKNHNKGYWKSETKMLQVIFKALKHHRGRLSVATISKELGLSRQAFYTHHHNINEAITEGEDALMEEFAEYINEKCPPQKGDGHTSNRRLYTACFIFISQRKSIFRQIAADPGQQQLFFRMALVMYPRMVIEWLPLGSAAPAPDSEQVELFLWCVARLVSRWASKEHCDFAKTGRYLKTLLAVTEEVGRKKI